MKRQGLVVLGLACFAAAAAGCFSDPTSSLRNGPSMVSLSYSQVSLAAGDSLTVTASVLDSQGNTYPATGATFTTASSAVARTGLDGTTPVPENYYVRGYIVAVASGATTITFTSRGVTGKVAVTVR